MNEINSVLCYILKWIFFGIGHSFGVGPSSPTFVIYLVPWIAKVIYSISFFLKNYL